MPNLKSRATSSCETGWIAPLCIGIADQYQQKAQASECVATYPIVCAFVCAF